MKDVDRDNEVQRCGMGHKQANGGLGWVGVGVTYALLQLTVKRLLQLTVKRNTASNCSSIQKVSYQFSYGQYTPATACTLDSIGVYSNEKPLVLPAVGCVTSSRMCYQQ